LFEAQDPNLNLESRAARQTGPLGFDDEFPRKTRQLPLNQLRADTGDAVATR
jgi:hypothetical protein